MLASLSDTLSFMERLFRNEEIMVKFTPRCTNNCRMCTCVDEEVDLLSLNLIEKGFNDLKNSDVTLLTLQGGEVMLYPEYCKEVFDLWRKIRKDEKVFTGMFSNGCWGNDQNLIDYFINEVHPNFLLLSVDKWHQEHNPIENIDNILFKLKDNKDILVMIISVFSKETPKCEKISQLGVNPIFDDIYIFFNPLTDTVITETETCPNRKYLNDEPIFCGCDAMSLDWDGAIRSDCSYADSNLNELSAQSGCLFGFIDKVNLLDAYKNWRRPCIKYTGEVGHFSEICRNLKINCFDKKWKKFNIAITNKDEMLKYVVEN
jgi:hypothetical protein